MRLSNVAEGKYLLGIFWALGRYVDQAEDPDGNYFLLRHNRLHFLWTVQRELNLTKSIFTVTRKGREQYRLKVPDLDKDELEELGWRPRVSKERPYPNIRWGHRAFVRAYIEIHSRVDSNPAMRKTGRSSSGPRLRIYGNKAFLEGLNQVLATKAGIFRKKVQQATPKSSVSGIIYLQSRRELQEIHDYLYRPPVRLFDPEYKDALSEAIEE